ncbi:hypothetical protein Calag_1082 [Caldisphaera lagunensis DSM 15908]|uniref:Small-conductance mechanosensitive channel n=1 Tax=Caldisphaera lagunensis (strain DSM 15908 / JCM 11604 / ANMR 0165 / IC-154) TaxID=1056495 RepID=L0ABK4_CALLD|nr:hypothetical protein [Caldisphaera lagunensis]AFZ70804.1 hypothetical protein Calag_1082 [Caldisphaera lagunensis DSM 15908]
MQIIDYIIDAVIFILIIVVFYLIGKFVKFLVKRTLEITGFNDWFKHISMGRITLRAGMTAGDFFGNLIAYFLYATGVILSIDYLSTYVTEIRITSSLLTKGLGYVALFVFIIIIGFILIDVFDSYISSEAKLRGGQELEILIVYIKIVLYITVITLAMREVSLDVTPLMILLQPLAWGLAIAFVALIISRYIRRA